MRIIITENKFDSVFSEWLDNSGINTRIKILDGSWTNDFNIVVVFGLLNI